MNNMKILKIGTRGSPLAMIQATKVAELLENLNSNLKIEIVKIKTTGDRIQNKRLSTIGGKALFTKELDIALASGKIHMAVHSIKDVETKLPPKMKIVCILKRDYADDALISNGNLKLKNLKKQAVVGTVSLRRQALLLRIRPDLRVVMIRGNVDTRLKKLDKKDVDALVLSLAGLNRLNLKHLASEVLDKKAFIPSAGQGAIAVQIYTGQNNLYSPNFLEKLLAPINCHKTFICIAAERAVLDALDGNCTTPVGAFAHLKDDKTISLSAFASTKDGIRFEQKTLLATLPNHLPSHLQNPLSSHLHNIDTATELGGKIGMHLRIVMGDDFDKI